MEFGICFDTHIDKWDLTRYAEELGYDRAWVPDSQMIWSDCYATMALAAHATKRIKIGTGVAIPGTRIAPVTAHSIATINQLAPGRVFLGIGTGHTAMRVMGEHPMALKDFREYLRVIRALLNGEESLLVRKAVAAMDRRWKRKGFRSVALPSGGFRLWSPPLASRSRHCCSLATRRDSKSPRRAGRSGSRHSLRCEHPPAQLYRTSRRDPQPAGAFQRYSRRPKAVGHAIVVLRAAKASPAQRV